MPTAKNKTFTLEVLKEQPRRRAKFEGTRPNRESKFMNHQELIKYGASLGYSEAEILEMIDLARVQVSDAAVFKTRKRQHGH